MKKAILAAAFLAATTATGAAQGFTIQKCNGFEYAGNYIGEAKNGAVSVDDINTAAGEKLVQETRPLGSLFIIINPVDSTMECNQFMGKVKDTGLFRNVAPNWIMRPMRPRP